METTPRLFTKLSIVFFSAMGTTFFGAIMYSTNLKETNKRKFIAPTIIFSIVFCFLVTKLNLFLNIPSYYTFIPVHLIGGLLLIGPFWRYQIGSIEIFEKRKVWIPAIVLLVPIALLLLIIFVNDGHNHDKLSSSEFQQAAQTEYNKAIENASFALNDSMYSFFDLDIPLLGSSYFFTTQVEDINTLYDYVDYEEGRFTTSCIRIYLSENELFNLNMFSNEYSFTPVDSINSCFNSFICANYVRRINDTLLCKGTIALIKIENIGYQYFTIYTDINKEDADNLSYSLINNITPDSLAQAKRKLRKELNIVSRTPFN